MKPSDCFRKLIPLVPAGLRVMSAGIQLIAAILIARILGDEASAVFFYWIAIVVTFSCIASYGLEHLALRSVPRFETNEKKEMDRFLGEIRTFVVVCSLLIGLGLFVFAIASNGGLQWWQCCLPISLGIQALTLIQASAMNGLSRPMLSVIFSHLMPTTIFCLAAAFFSRHLGGEGLLVAHMVAFAIPLLWVRLGPVRELNTPHFFKLSSARIRSLVGESGPVFLFGVFGCLSFVLPLVIFESHSTQAEVSHTTNAFRIAILVSLVSTAIHNYFSPKLSLSIHRDEGILKVFSIYGMAVSVALVSLTIPLLAGVFFPVQIMSLFGEGFKAGATTLRWLCLCQFGILFFGPYYQLLIMNHQAKALACLAGFSFCVTITLAFLLVPVYGGTGYVISFSVPAIFQGVIGLILVLRKLNSKKEQAEVFRVSPVPD